MSSTENTTEISKIASAGGLIIGDDTSQYIETQIKNGWPDLSPPEIAFSQEYCINGYNHRNAAKHINNNASTGITWLRRPLIRSYIAWLQAEQRTESLITKDFIEAQMMHQYEKANGDVEVNMVDGEGNQFQGKVYQGQLSISILKEFNNMFGHSKERTEKSARINIILDAGALTGRPSVVIEDGEVIDGG